MPGGGGGGGDELSDKGVLSVSTWPGSFWEKYEAR